MSRIRETGPQVPILQEDRRRPPTFARALHIRCAGLVLIVAAAGIAPLAARSPGTLRASDAPATPAGRAIARAERAVASPSIRQRARAHAELSLALSRRARETSDPAFYERALAAAADALALEPGSLAACRARVWALLGLHRFEEALPLARAVAERAPDDLAGYALVADAAAELGLYDEAEAAVQWMLDLRPGDVRGLTRAAHLREIFGDLEGADQLMQVAYERIAPRLAEDRAWVLCQRAHLARIGGDPSGAMVLARRALDDFPDYHYALAELGHALAALGRPADAADVFRRRYRRAPHPENLADWAAALERAGQGARAASVWQRFERAARAEIDAPDNANRALAFYWLDRSGDVSAGFDLARREFERRRDVGALELWAWACHRTGRHAEALATVRELEELGVRDPAILERARAIRAAAGA